MSPADGLGIIDNFIQSHKPSKHYIVEAHPDVLRDMKRKGWYGKPGVVVVEGRWQDSLPSLVEEGLCFDAIYFDTYAEDYRALRLFFDVFVPSLLDHSGEFGFFNGLGADRQVCYDVYTKIVEMDLLEAGFRVEYVNLKVPNLQNDGTWNDLERPYWKLEEYRLPRVTFCDA